LLDHFDEDQRLVEIVGHGRGSWTSGMGQS
jgi:hypothetical protein